MKYEHRYDIDPGHGKILKVGYRAMTSIKDCYSIYRYIDKFMNKI